MLMENQTTFEKMLREFLTPIIEDAVETVLNRKQGLFQPPPAPKQPLPELMSIKMVAEYIHLSVPTVYGLVSKQTIPHYKRGNRLYFKREDIEKWISEGRRSTMREVEDSVGDFTIRRRRK